MKGTFLNAGGLRLPMSCDYVSCRDEGYVELTLGSRHYVLCRKHYLIFQDLMQKLALQYGEAILTNVKVVKAGKGIRLESFKPLSDKEVEKSLRSSSRFLGLIKGVLGVVEETVSEKVKHSRRSKTKRRKSRTRRAKRRKIR